MRQKPSAYTPNRVTLFLVAGALVALSVLAHGEPLDRRGSHAYLVNRSVDRLTPAQDVETLRTIRLEIAGLRPAAATLAVLARRYASADAFLRNQIESIIGQTDFSDSASQASIIAASTTEFDLFVAIAYGLGHSPSADARQHALKLIDDNQFSSGRHAEAAADTIRWVLSRTIVSSDFGWLESALERGELSAAQLSVAIRAADRLRSTEAIAFVQRAASLSHSDDERVMLLQTLEQLRSGTRPDM